MFSLLCDNDCDKNGDYTQRGFGIIGFSFSLFTVIHSLRNMRKK